MPLRVVASIPARRAGHRSGNGWQARFIFTASARTPRSWPSWKFLISVRRQRKLTPGSIPTACQHSSPCSPYSPNVSPVSALARRGARPVRRRIGMADLCGQFIKVVRLGCAYGIGREDGPIAFPSRKVVFAERRLTRYIRRSVLSGVKIDLLLTPCITERSGRGHRSWLPGLIRRDIQASGWIYSSSYWRHPSTCCGFAGQGCLPVLVVGDRLPGHRYATASVEIRTSAAR